MAFQIPSGVKAIKGWHVAVLLAALYLVIGLSVVDDYGISYDEEIQRVDNGLPNYNYVTGSGRGQLQKYHGPAFQIVLMALEKGLGLDDTRAIYMMRHTVNFLTFFASIIVLFLLARAVFSSDKWGLFAAMMYGLSPRFFAESFYNGKDMVFLAFFTFSLYTLYHFVKKLNFKWAIIHALVTGFMVDIRVMGVIIPIATLAFIVYQYMVVAEKRITLQRTLAVAGVFLVVQLLAIFAFWPILWDRPGVRFMEAFSQMSQYPWVGNVLYMGQIHAESDLQWHYLLVWMAITIPLFYQLVAVVGVVGVASKIVSFKKAVHERYRFDFLFLALAVGPLALIIVMGSVVYDGWRHVYFIYAPLVLVATRGIALLWDSTRPHLGPLSRKATTLGLFALAFATPVHGIVSGHPYQFVYFNRAAMATFSPIEEHFEMDYWGLSYRQGLEYLLALEDSTPIRLMSENPSGLDNRLLLQRAERDRLEYVGDIYAPGIYYLANHRATMQKEPPFRSEPVHQLKTAFGRTLWIYRSLDSLRIAHVSSSEKQTFDNCSDQFPFDEALSGDHVDRVGKGDQYGYVFQFNVDSLFLTGIPAVRVNGSFRSEESSPDLRYVVTVDRLSENVLRESAWPGRAFDRAKRWVKWDWNCRLDRNKLKINDVVSVYMWSVNEDVVYQDDVQVTFLTYTDKKTLKPKSL